MSDRGMRIWGQTLLLTPVHDPHHRDLARYSAIWCTSGYDVNKNKTRTFVPLVLEVRQLCFRVLGQCPSLCYTSPFILCP